MRRPDAEGFTLVEVLVAVAITSLLLLTVFGIFSSVSRTRTALEGEGEEFHQARVLFDRIGRELRSAYLRQDNPRTLFAGGTDEDGNLFLEFSTTVASPILGGKAGGLSLVRYELNPEDPAQRGGRVLLRRESPLFAAGRDEAKTYRLAADIEEMSLRFYAGNSGWKDAWDSAVEKKLPLMVELTMAFTVEGRRLPFRTTVELSLAGS